MDQRLWVKVVVLVGFQFFLVTVHTAYEQIHYAAKNYINYSNIYLGIHIIIILKI